MPWLVESGVQSVADFFFLVSNWNNDYHSTVDSHIRDCDE